MTGMRVSLMLTTVLASACTTLGPVPATTAVTARPAQRPDLDLQAAIAPGYFLSSSVRKDPEGSGIQQLSATIEPDRWIKLPGLIAGARVVGKDGDTHVEPLLGYRATVGDAHSLALAGIVFGSHSEATVFDGSYSSNRGGAEVAADLILVRHSWVALHGSATTSLHWISANGEYCLDPAGIYGDQCPTNGGMAAPGVTSISGVYGSATIGLALNIARERPGFFHGVRVALMFAAGTMPRVVAQEQEAGTRYASAGLSLSFAVGAE